MSGKIMKNDKIEICKETVVNYEKVEAVKNELPSTREIADLSEIFKVLGDPTRLKIVLALAKEELCVCDLATLVNLSVSAISHQLRLLRNLRLVKYRKSGKMVYYMLDDDHIESIINQALIHIRE
jgi:ArsR family transcriptional regulator, lead/cadmium/zinc/bismuth-responsive transcriptional repressor